MYNALQMVSKYFIVDEHYLDFHYFEISFMFFSHL